MKRYVLIIGSMIAVTLVGCNSNSSSEHVYQMNDHRDEQHPDNLLEIIEASDTIVKGSFTELLKTDNMARQEADPTQSSDLVYIEGQIYNFTVEESFKGESLEELNAILPYLNEIPVFNDEEEIVDDVLVEAIDYEGVDLNSEYILFLLDASFIEEGLYSPAAQSFIVEADDVEPRFLSKRIEGQLDESIELESVGDEATMVTEVRDDISVDVTREFKVIPNYLDELNIETVEELEVYLENQQ